MAYRKNEGEAVLQGYLDLMDAQREEMFSQLENLTQENLWHRPQPEEWSIGENIDHLRVIYTSALPFFKTAWFMLYPLAYLRRNKPFQVDIDNVYRRPGFPQNVGWIWPPKYTSDNPVSFSELKQGLAQTHRYVRNFYTCKPAGMLGNLPLYDPAIGWLNMIQALRVGIYHDEMHFAEIKSQIDQIVLLSKK